MYNVHIFFCKRGVGKERDFWGYLGRIRILGVLSDFVEGYRVYIINPWLGGT